MKYNMRSEIEIIRQQHEITMTPRGTAAALKDALKHVPGDAILIDICPDNESGTATLIFEIEMDAPTHE